MVVNYGGIPLCDAWWEMQVQSIVVGARPMSVAHSGSVKRGTWLFPTSPRIVKRTSSLFAEITEEGQKNKSNYDPHTHDMVEPIRRRTRRQAAADEDDSHDSAPSSSAPAPPRSTINTLKPSPTSSTVASSSFFSVPTAILTGVGLPPLGRLLGQRIYGCISCHVQDGPASQLLEALLTAKEGLLIHVWAILQASVFRDNTVRSAVPYLAAAVVLNHARRTLWFGDAAAGFFVLPQPDDDWRLLLARPEVFLEDAVKAVMAGGFMRAMLLKRTWDILAGAVTASLIMADDATLLRSMTRAVVLLAPPKRAAVTRTLVRRAKDVVATLFVVWLFSCIEYAVAQASATLAIGYAVWMMLRVPGKGGLDLLVRILFGGSTATTAWVILFGWLQLVVFSWTGLAPLVTCSLSNPLRQPGVLLALTFAVAAMNTVLRYRSRLYIAIETSGLFVFLAYAGISALLVVSNWVEKKAKERRGNGVKET